MEGAKLITALERADEGSEYLDYTIQRGYGLMKPVPAYTRSMDAAISLIPTGWSIHRLQRRNDCRGNFTGWVAELYRANDVVLEVPSLSQAASAPLAIAAASLRVIDTLAAAEKTAPPPAPPAPVAEAPAMRVANGRFLAR